MNHSDPILQRLQETILDSCADYTAEAIAVALMQHGFSSDRLVMQSMGTLKRPYRKDVSGFHIVSGEEDAGTLYLHTHRDGLYDALPESIFHALSGKARQPHKQEILDEIRLHREEAAAARKFFLPYEQSFQDVRRVLYGLEERFGYTDGDCPLTELFVSEWPILQRLDPQKGYLFVRMIPLLHTIRNEYDAVAECLSLLLDAEICIQHCTNPLSGMASDVLPLGAAALGSDVVVGASAPDVEDDLILEVALQDAEASMDFVPCGSKYGLIEELCDYFFSAQSMVSVVFTQKHREEGFVMDGKAVLGMGVRI